MKYKVAWSSPTQGIKSTTVDAINISAAQEQVESMYANIDGFSLISTSPVFDREEYSEPSDSGQSYSESGGGDSLSTVIGGGAIFIGAVIVFAGFFFLPAGILAMIVGGLVGWLGMKLGFWLSDRGW